jgi:hypothetical protein
LQLAHGVGRIYDLPVPLEYYLTGSALTVLASFLATAVLARRSEARTPRRVLGARGARAIASVVRVATWAGYALALVTGVAESATGFAFSSIWLWVGLVVVLTALNAVFGNLSAAADPWLPLASLLPRSADSSNRRSAGPLARYAGPALLFVLFWLELASGQGFNLAVLTPVLLLYSVYAVWIRSRDPNWAAKDPFAILHQFASRASLLKITGDGIYLRSPGADPEDRRPMSPPIHAALFVLLGATSLDNLRETHGWERVREAIGSAAPEMLYDTIALTLLGLPFFITFWLALLPARRRLAPVQPRPEKASLSASRRPIEAGRRLVGRTFAWALAPIGIAYLLAHNASLFLVTLPVWFETFSDPLGLGWNLVGLGGVLARYEPSPALVWFLEVALVVGGHILAVVMGHRIAQGLSANGKAPLGAQIPITLLMSVYTVGTLWLLSLSVVRS